MPRDQSPADGGSSALTVIRDRSVAVYLLAAGASGTGMFLQAAALGKQVFDITDSELALGVLGLVEFVPVVLLLALTGSAADRFDRRRVASIGLAAEALMAMLFLWYATTNPSSALPIFVVAAGFGCARAYVTPSMRSIPPLIAPDRALPSVMAVYVATWQAGLIIGPASSGLLYDIDPAVPYAASAGCFALAAGSLVLLRTRRPQQRTPPEQRATWQHALEGLRFVRSRPILLGAISLDLFAVLFGGVIALLPAIAEDRLGVGNVGYGWLRAAPGIGAVVIAALVAMRPIRRRIGRSLLVAVALFGVGTVVLGITRNYAVAFVALVAVSGADAVSVFIRTTIVPLATPDHMRGRVAAVENVFIGGSNEVGAFESGVASTLIGVGPAVVLGGALTVVVVGVWWFLFPALRDIDTFAEVDAVRGDDEVTVDRDRRSPNRGDGEQLPLLEHEAP